MSTISDRAVVSPKAKIGNDCTIYPFVYIEDDVVIGDGCTIYPGANLLNGTRMGSNNTVYQNTVIAAVPQDFNYQGAATTCQIGDGNTFRENVVINRATFTTGSTEIGNQNFFMEGVHISHDCHIGNRNVFGYGAKLGGDCQIASNTLISSGVIANQGIRVGDCSMVQSGCRFSKDVPPYIIAGSHPIKFGGINSFVIEQMGIDEKVKAAIANAYRLVFAGQDAIENIIGQIRQQIKTSPEIDNIVAFLETSQLGLISKI